MTPVEHYLAAVAAARDAVRDGQLTKAVIAREIAVTADRPIDRHGVLHRLKASFGSSYRYAVDGLDRRLARAARRGRRRRRCASHPLAGTAPRTGDVGLDAEIAAALVASTKNQVEHRVVIDVVHDTLLPWCSFLDWEPDPSIVTVANVQHLGTRIEGLLSSPPPNVLELVRALSPTPALGGHPRDEALALIADGRGRRPRALRRCGRLGRRRRQRHVGGHHPLRRALRRRPRAPASTPAAASSPTATRSPSWPRPRPSSRRCCSAP